MNSAAQAASQFGHFTTRYEGQRAVREGFASVWESFPDAQWLGARHFIVGDRGVSEWTFMGTNKDGQRVEINGCDVFTFRDGKILVKNSYRKKSTIDQLNTGGET